MAATYTGPSVKTMIETHTLANEVIARHNDACPILDENELALLERFCANPDIKNSVLREHGVVDDPADKPGTKANTKWGSLVGYTIARHGTDDPVLLDGEIETLKHWFESESAKRA